MLGLQNKKTRFYLNAMWISFAILLIVFISTDSLTGDKEFSEYTRDDWAVAMLPLAVMAVSGISTLVFALIIIIPMFRMYPALANYVSKKKFSEIEPETEFLAFDHNELKRACCRAETEKALWISVKEYDLKTRSWTVLEEGRRLESADDLRSALQDDYGYDKVKIYYLSHRPQQ